MSHILKVLGLIIIWTSYSFGQVEDNDKSFNELKMIRLSVLKNNIIGKKYYYDYTKDTNCNKTCLRYLGQLKTKNNKIYKVMTCFYVHGQSCRGTSRILVYDSRDNYEGNYYVGMPEDLPDSIVNNSLVYLRSNSECEFRKETKISFVNGLPKTIFIPCKKPDIGDLYSFSKEE